MSYATVFEIQADGKVSNFAEVRNGLAGAPVIWRKLSEKYGFDDPMGFGTHCFCGEPWNVPAKECAGGHPMPEVEVLRLRTALEKIVDSHCGDPECGCCGMDRLTALDALETQQTGAAGGKETP